MTDKLSQDELAAIAEFYKHHTRTHAMITIESLLAHIETMQKRIRSLQDRVRSMNINHMHGSDD